MRERFPVCRILSRPKAQNLSFGKILCFTQSALLPAEKCRYPPLFVPRLSGHMLNAGYASHPHICTLSSSARENCGYLKRSQPMSELNRGQFLRRNVSAQLHCLGNILCIHSVTSGFSFFKSEYCIKLTTELDAQCAILSFLTILY